MWTKYRKSTIAGITDLVSFGSPCGGGGLLRAQRRPRQCCHLTGISMLPFQKKYGVCLNKRPTIVMINRCGNETGKVPFVFSM